MNIKARLPGKAPSIRRGPPPKPTSRVARQLALAHHIDRLVESGRLKDYATAAAALGLTRARLTQIMNLLTLSPRIQERLLSGALATGERRLRRATGMAVWTSQEMSVTD